MPFNTIISTSTLEDNIDNANWVIFDCRSSLADPDAGLKAYHEGHIANSHFCNLETDLSSPITAESGRHPLPDFEKLAKKLGNWGVDGQTQVVVYDDVGGAFAVRLWWQLRAFGHNSVAVLDGGIPQWIKEGRPLTTKITEVTKVTANITKATAKKFSANMDRNSWLSTAQVEENLTTKKYMILDARTPERFRGESEPIDTVAGRIPNTINHAFQNNLGQDGLFLSADELREMFKPIIEQTPSQSANNLVHLCGSGVTACHNMLALEIAGITGSKLYAGSWSEWIRDNNRPVATG